MAAPTDTPTKGTGDPGAESPTTVRPLDMDDDDVQDTTVLSGEGNPTTPAGQSSAANATTTAPADQAKPSTTTAETDNPPAKPPRPQTEAQKNEMILQEAFPSVEPSVIRAVLRASSGRVEPAFNALLEMTDPDAAKNEPQENAPPPPPPRPQGRREMSQLEADELYARQLAEHYDNVGAYESRTSNRHRDDPPRQRQRAHDEDDKDYSFIDDDLPAIRDNLRQGFLETQTKVNSWVTALKKRLEDSFDESEDQPPRPPPRHRPGEPSRRSGDYDADPQVLSDDFAGMRFSADGTPVNRSQTGIYRPPPSSSPRPGSGRRVGFKEETEEINMYERSPPVPPKDEQPAKASKWQPLSTVEPSPIGDNDPFSLGDSEDEKDNKDAKDTKDAATDKPKETTSDDNERLKKAAAEAMAENLVEPGKEGSSKTSTT